ncbi:MAG: hypothetical protein EXS05_00415 [Planctomycetaceae bacterium]|nr:hypothetical protein [Planctomycetaceae bacterium]
MPIIEPSKPWEPLCQGDLLKEVSLRSTRAPWNADELSTSVLKHRLCIVISRPCVAMHANAVVVSAIEQYTHRKPTPFEDFDEAMQFYKDLRDGHSSPDLFYLGQVEGFEGSFCAHLDSLHTIDIPKVKPKRAEFIADRRIARLTPEFAKDLHLRIFRSYASLGFDDHSWLSTDDLTAVVGFGKRDVLKIATEIQALETRIHSLRSQGTGNSDDITGLQTQLKKKEEKHNKIETAIFPYQEEFARRSPLGETEAATEPS